MTTSSESSVMFSLAELARLEEDRVQAEATEALRARERREREQREVLAAKQQQEQHRLDSERQERVERVQRESETKAREEARERAAIETARIEAEGKVRLAAEEQARVHELALLRTRIETGGRRLSHALAISLGLVVCLAAVGTLTQRQRLMDLENQAADSLGKLNGVTAERDGLARRVAALTTAIEQCESRNNDHLRSAPLPQPHDNAPLPPNRTPDRRHPPPSATPAQRCDDGDPMCNSNGMPISGG